MKTIQTVCQGDLSYPFSYPKEDLLFFDIETTGFSAKISALYLIGVLFYTNDHWNTLQWFADDYQSEEALLKAFFSFIKSFQCLIHFNGTGFDIPFIEKKCKQHKLPTEQYNFSSIESIDIYKIIFPHRKRIQTSNLKQKTLEQFLHINRTDVYSGGELIAFYQNYHKARSERALEEATEIENLLLLHNHDDLVGMLQFSNILFLADLLNGTVSLTNIKHFINEDLLMLRATLPFSSEKLFWTGEDAAIQVEHNTLTILVSIYETELKYFYEDYKNYYYLPMEDTAIHKSVASYVDKAHRERAKKENCYIKKTGKFIPVYTTTIAPVFKDALHSKKIYIALEENFLSNTNLLSSYINSSLKDNNAIVLQSDTEVS